MTAVTALDQAWAALGGGSWPVELRLDPRPILGARLPVGDLAQATVGACALAGAELAAARGRRFTEPIRLDAARIATAFTSERHLRVDGARVEPFAPESAFFAAADGWVRTHANYPHHRDRLRAVLGEDVAAAIAARPADEVAEAVTAAGGLAVVLRGPGEWAGHPQGAAVARLPLVGRHETSPSVRATARARVDPPLPAAGVRVLDLTRVIAGPVATRTLALLGADVLRVDCPRYPEIAAQHLDTGLGKRSTLLDLGVPGDFAVWGDLLASADVVVTGYRPGALDRFGLDPASLAHRYPGLIVARLSAWGPTGPWAHRRGFDSLVQAASGIAVVEGSPGRPGVLPAQALDHGTGYLLAAAILRALAARYADGCGRVVELALARTAAWLSSLPRTTGTLAADLPPTLAELAGSTFAEPALTLPGGPASWPAPPGPWGADEPVWR